MPDLPGISDMPETPEIPDVAELLEQVRKQQAEVERIQLGVEAMEVTGGSRRGEVRVTVRGNGQVTRVIIDPDALVQYDVNELGDLITEAANDTLRKVAEASSERFRPFMEAASQAGEF
jgi:DNA-binding YbaB/EbfC family protein